MKTAKIVQQTKGVLAKTEFGKNIVCKHNMQPQLLETFFQRLISRVVLW